METSSTVEFLKVDNVSICVLRDATLADIPRMVEMGQHFRGSTKYEKYLRGNPERMAQLGRELIAKGSLMVYAHADECGETLVGMLGYVVYNHFISGDIIVGEVFLWVEPKYRGHGLELVQEMERRGKALGATVSQMIAPDERIGRIYQHIGYEGPIESTYQKNI